MSKLLAWVVYKSKQNSFSQHSMKALSNTQQEPQPELEQGELLKNRLSELQATNKSKETLIAHLEQGVAAMEEQNRQLEEEVRREEAEWDEVQARKQEEKSENEDEKEMINWIENVQKHNGLPQAAIDALLTIQFEGGQHEICLSCYGPLTVGALCTYLPCSHLFHRDCIGNHLRVNKFCLACQEPVE